MKTPDTFLKEVNPKLHAILEKTKAAVGVRDIMVAYGEHCVDSYMEEQLQKTLPDWITKDEMRTIRSINAGLSIDAGISYVNNQNLKNTGIDISIDQAKEIVNQIIK